MASLSRKLKRANSKPVKLSEPQAHGKWITNEQLQELMRSTVQGTVDQSWAIMMAAASYVLLYHWDKLQDPNYRLRAFKDLMWVVSASKTTTPNMKDARHKLFMQTGLEIIDE